MSQEPIIGQYLVILSYHHIIYHMITNYLTYSMTKTSKEMLVSVKLLRMRYAECLEENCQQKLTNEHQIQKELLQRGINHLE